MSTKNSNPDCYSKKYGMYHRIQVAENFGKNSTSCGLYMRFYVDPECLQFAIFIFLGKRETEIGENILKSPTLVDK